MKQPKNSRITLGPAEIEAMVRKGAAQVGRGALVVNIPENDLSYVPRDGIIGHLRYLDDAPTVDQLAELIDSTDPNHAAIVVTINEKGWTASMVAYGTSASAA